MKVIHQVKIFPLLSMLFSGSILFSHTALADKSSLDESHQSTPIVFTPAIMGDQPIIQGEKPDQDLPLRVVFQNEHEARDADNTLLAQELGLQKEDIEKSIAFQDAFDRYATRLRTRYPDQISGIWVESVPATIGRIRFIGEVPTEVSAEIEKRGQGDQIILTGGSSIREQDHPRRTSLVANALTDLNLTNFIFNYDMIKDVINVQIIRPEEAAPLKKSEILEAVRRRAKKSVLTGAAAVFHPDDINLNVIIGTEQAYIPRAHYGGLNAHLLPNTYSSVCTTGWSVKGPYGAGVITAGHCALPYGGVESYTSHLFQIGITRKDYRFNFQGDAGYYDMDNGWGATDDFYADATHVRDTVSIMPTNQMMNKHVCRYGRASNYRSCGHKVIATFAGANYNGTSVHNLVQITHDTSLDGDSGGGWSWVYSAWGVHSGSSSTDNTGFFMPVERIENIFGVTVKH